MRMVIHYKSKKEIPIHDEALAGKVGWSNEPLNKMWIDAEVVTTEGTGILLNVEQYGTMTVEKKDISRINNESGNPIWEE